MKNLTHKDLMAMSDNKIIFHIDLEYHAYLFKIVNSITKSFKGIPEDADSIYWEFMFFVPSILRSLTLAEDQAFKTILGIKCRHFTFNKCRSLSTRSHEVMNYARELDETMQSQFEAQDSSLDESISLNLKLLTPLELEVFNLYFIENHRLSQVAKKLKLSLYKTTKIYEVVIAKLKDDLKRSGLI